MNAAAAVCHAAVMRAGVTPLCELCHVTAPWASTNTWGDSWRTAKRVAMCWATSRCCCTTTSCTGPGNGLSLRPSRTIRLTPQLWLCLKTMTGSIWDAASTASTSASDASARNEVTVLFYRAAVVALVLASGTPRGASAQEAVGRGGAEWSVAASLARGIGLLQSAGGERYAMPTLSWGRVLTDLRGPGWARGRFEWAVEVTPIFAEWSSGRARGVGLAPLQWRWNLAPRGRLYPFAEVGGGALWTTQPIPTGTTGSNFMTHGGVGLRVLGGRGRGLVASYRLHHISNGNRLRRNPGVNAHMITVGYTWLTRP